MRGTTTRFVCAILITLSTALYVRAASDTWKAAVLTGNWETGTNWIDGSTPGNGDTATFNTVHTFGITFGTAPTAIQQLSVIAGTVTFQSSGGSKTLSVNSGGAQTLSVTGSGTTLNLGDNVGGNPLNLTLGAGLAVNGGASAATLNIRSG